MSTSHLVNLPRHLDVLSMGDLFTATIQASVHYDDALRRYHNASVIIEHPVQPVSSTSIRKIPIHRRISLATRDLLRESNQSLLSRAPVKTYFKGTQGRKVSQKVAGTPTRQHLEDAAVIFHLAASIRDMPVRSIERCFGITYKQAKRWVRIARREQILDR